jgi:hypothetical protein
MGMMKNYLLRLLQQCSEENFGQDAIEWAVVTGLVRLSYELDRDIREIMPRYDEIIEAYRRSLAQGTKDHHPPLAPMKRAAPARRVKNSESETPIRRKSAA